MKLGVCCWKQWLAVLSSINNSVFTKKCQRYFSAQTFLEESFVRCALDLKNQLWCVLIYCCHGCGGVIKIITVITKPPFSSMLVFFEASLEHHRLRPKGRDIQCKRPEAWRWNLFFSTRRWSQEHAWLHGSWSSGGQTCQEEWSSRLEEEMSKQDLSTKSGSLRLTFFSSQRRSTNIESWISRLVILSWVGIILLD